MPATIPARDSKRSGKLFTPAGASAEERLRHTYDQSCDERARCDSRTQLITDHVEQLWSNE
jgi:hypothetical protein